MDGEELARLAAAVAEGVEHLHVLPLDHVDLHVLAVGQVEELLLLVGREGDVPRRALGEGLGSDEHFVDVGAVGLKDLNAISRPIADVKQPVGRDVGAVDRTTELGRGRIAGRVLAEVQLVVRGLAVGAPVAFELAGVGVDHDDPAVEVAVRNVDLVRLRVDGELRDAAEVLHVVAVAHEPRLVLASTLVDPRVRLADLHQELAVAGELEGVGVAAAVAPDPHVVHVIDEDAVVRRRPFELAALARTAPVADQVAVRIELEHRRRRNAALGERRILRGADLVDRAEGAWRVPVDDPDVIAGVDRDADRRAEDPVVRQRLGPERIDLEARRHRSVAGHVGGLGAAVAATGAEN